MRLGQEGQATTLDRRGVLLSLCVGGAPITGPRGFGKDFWSVASWSSSLPLAPRPVPRPSTPEQSRGHLPLPGPCHRRAPWTWGPGSPQPAVPCGTLLPAPTAAPALRLPGRCPVAGELISSSPCCLTPVSLPRLCVPGWSRGPETERRLLSPCPQAARLACV